MRKLYAVVEGEGDKKALPVLLHRLLQAREHGSLGVAEPKKAGSQETLRSDFERFLNYVRRERDCAGLFILVDTDRDACPFTLAQNLSQRARQAGLPFPTAIVCPHSEYETWFLASLDTVRGHCNLPAALTYEQPVENKRGVKEWLSGQMPQGRRYRETEHQPELTRHIDPTLARRHSRSFRRLESALDQLLAAIKRGETTVTP